MKIYAIPDQFARARILKGYSQRELARKSNLSNTYISLLEGKRKSVSPATAKKLSDLLDQNVESLFVIELKTPD